MEAAAAAEPARSSPSTAVAAPRPPKQRPRLRRGGPAEEQVRIRRRTLEAVLEQCQRTLEMLKNADLEPDPDAGDEIGSKGSARGEEEEEEEEEEVRSCTPSSVDYETDEGFVYLGLIYMQGFTTENMANPWRTYVKLAAVLMGSHGLTKGSLAFLNYPAQLMFKSTKAQVATLCNEEHRLDDMIRHARESLSLD